MAEVSRDYAGSMAAAAHPVCVCIFRADDGKSVRERLMAVAEYYRNRCGSSETAEDLGVAQESNCADVNGTGANCAGVNYTGVNSGAAPVDIWQIDRTHRGKPYFPYQPKLHFSISHSGEYWACAMADQPIGLDLQEHVTRKDETPEIAAARYGKMAQRFFHPKEAEYVKQDSYRRFFEIWAARESYVKYTGQGIDDHFGEICVLPEEGQKEYLSDGILRSWHASEAWFWEGEFPAGYTLCICVKERGNDPVVGACGPIG